MFFLPDRHLVERVTFGKEGEWLTSTIKILTNNCGSAASAKAAVEPVIPTLTPQRRLQNPTVSPPQNNEYPACQPELPSLIACDARSINWWYSPRRWWIWNVLELNMDRGAGSGHTGIVITDRILICRVGNLGWKDNSHNDTYSSMTSYLPVGWEHTINSDDFTEDDSTH